MAGQMTKKFKPQETTMNSYQETETKLYNRFVSFGYDANLAQAIAHSFTNFVLGYLTMEGVAHHLILNGADEDTARSLAEDFRDVRDSVEQGAQRKAH
jgi:hypothetical protein